MTSLRRWLIGLAAGWFLAGLMVGLAVPRGIEAWFPRETEADADDPYVRRMAETYGLTRDQQDLLWIVCANKRRDQRHIYENAARDSWDQLPKAMQNALLTTDRKAEQRVEGLLTKEQLDRFKRDRGGALEERGPGK